MEDEYFADNMVIYIEKKLTENFNYNSTWVQKYEKMIDILLDMCNFFDNYKFTRLFIHFYWISHNNIKYINF